VTAIPLVRRLPGASSNLPERLARTDLKLALQRHSYSVLLPVGFAVPFPSLETRCALTAPFHPYRGQNATQPRRSVLCGTVPEAGLRLRGNRPRRTLSGTVRPWSPDFPPRPPFGIGAGRPSGRLTGKTWRGRSAASRRALFYPPLEGRVACQAKRRQAGWGELLAARRFTPPRSLSLATLPLQGRVKTSPGRGNNWVRPVAPTASPAARVA
jgi:hypothetical protein